MVAMLLLGSWSATSAQDSAPALAHGLGSPATWTDDRGEPLAAVTVNAVDDDWQDFSDYSAPQAGSTYVAVHFTVQNLSKSNLIAQPFDFTLVDFTGRNYSRSYVSVADNASITPWEEDVALAPGESVDLVLVYQLLTDIPPSVFVWQPDSGVLVMVVLDGADNGSAPAPATPATPNGN